MQTPPESLIQIQPNSSSRPSLTGRVKRAAARHGLTVSAVTSVDPFPETAAHIERHIDAGRMEGLDWYTKERARVAADVRNLQARPCRSSPWASRTGRDQRKLQMMGFCVAGFPGMPGAGITTV